MIKVIKLMNGDEVIGDEMINTELAVTLNKPRAIQMVPTERGMSAALVPWVMMMPDSEVQINRFGILAELEATPELEKMFLQQTSSLDLTSRM